jgi:hypothetical protein
MDGERHVTRNGAGDEGAISDVPWALVFDPAINVRALGEIQARGFRAAADLVDRFVNLADNNSPAAAVDDGVGSDHRETSPGPRRPDVERLLDSWKGMIGQVAGSLRGATSPQRPGVAAFDFVASDASGQVNVEVTEPGVASTEVWLHNGGPTDRGTVVMRCGDLLSHDGSVISSANIRFDPEAVPMPARCSRGVSVQVAIDENVPAGRYHGTLLVDGHPDIWLPVVVTVEHSVE